MNGTIAGRTPCEARQYRKDHGQRAATALGYKLLADFLRDDEDGPLPPASTVYAPVMAGSDEERMAVVDAWAALHKTSAGWDAEHHHYCAKLPFGPVSLMVYMMPDAPADREPVLAGTAAA